MSSRHPGSRVAVRLPRKLVLLERRIVARGSAKLRTEASIADDVAIDDPKNCLF
jgi:hypothetical protein